MSDYLNEILRHKREEVEDQRRRMPLANLKECAGYAQHRRSLKASLQGHSPAVIAEIKAASPSKGSIRTVTDVAGIAASLARGGAAALSVLTDKMFFGGRIEYLPLARGGHSLPVLRKDFILDPYQVHQARAYEADAILLIVAALEKSRLRDLYHLARELGLEVLVEVHSEAELASISGEPVEILGINNRNLTTFHTDIETSIRLCALAPSGSLVVSESGIQTRSQIDRLAAHGIHAFLVGETLMRAPEPGQALRSLLTRASEGPV